MNRATEWIDFWVQHLQASTRIVIENPCGEEISGDKIWKTSEVLLSELQRKGCSAGTVVATTNSGFRLIRDILATALCGAILKPLPPKPVVGEANLPSSPALLVQQDTVTRLAVRPEPEYPPDTVLLLYTSGSSTGSPSLIPLTGSGLISQLVNHGAVFSNDWERTRLSILPHHHAFGLILDLLLGVYMQQRVECDPSLSRLPHELLGVICRKKIEFIALVPRVLELLDRKFKQQPTALDAMTRIHIHTGGAPIRPNLRDNLSSSVRKLTIGYGLTEAGPGVLIDGVPVGCEVKLVELTLEQSTSPTCPPPLGILWVRSPSLSPALTTDSTGYFCTNDIAIYNENCIEVIGRSGTAIKDANGTWIQLSCLEHELLQFPDIMGAKVYAHDTTLKVFIITNRGSSFNPGLCQIIEQALMKRTNRVTQVHSQPLTPEKEAELTSSTSKGFESLFP